MSTLNRLSAKVQCTYLKRQSAKLFKALDSALVIRDYQQADSVIARLEPVEARISALL